ncbi:hypothetical protein ACFL1H_00175 [Nanoarchaeota archaeon]
MKKKGATVVLEEIIKISLTLLIVALLFIPIIAGIYRAVIKAPNPYIVNGFDRLSEELNRIESGEEITFPFVIHGTIRNYIVIFEGDNAKKACGSRYCVCMIKDGSVGTEELNRCKKVNKKITGDKNLGSIQNFNNIKLTGKSDSINLETVKIQ